MNFSSSSHYIEGIVGKEFIERRFPGNLKGLTPLVLFTGGLFLPFLIEEISFRHNYYLYSGTINALENAYILEFHRAGGILGDFVETGKFVKLVRTVELDELYKEIMTYQEPSCGIIVEVLRKYNL